MSATFKDFNLKMKVKKIQAFLEMYLGLWAYLHICRGSRLLTKSIHWQFYVKFPPQLFGHRAFFI